MGIGPRIGLGNGAGGAGTFASVTNTGALVESASITPTALSGSTSNYAPTGFSGARVVYQNTTGAATLTGLAGGTDGRVITFTNTGSSTLIFNSEDGSSLAANRFQFPAAAQYVLENGAVNQPSSLTLRYSSAAGSGTGRWLLMSVVSKFVGGATTFGSDATFQGALQVNGNTTLGNGTSDAINIVGDVLGRTSTGVYGWAASTDPTATKDTGLSRSAAGVVEINNGTAGTLRDLTLRKITASDRASLTGLALTNYASASPSGAVNDYALVDVSTQPGLRLDAGVATVISGLAISQVSGSVVVIHNISAVNSITLTHDTLSTAANRFYLPNNADVVIRPNGSATFRYDGTSSRWRMIGSAL